jgi:hypothetical protein
MIHLANINNRFDYSLWPLISRETLLRNSKYKYSLEVAHKIGGKLGSNYTLDQEWIDLIEVLAEQRKDKLKIELNSYKKNLIKESIQMGYNDFGDFL